MKNITKKDSKNSNVYFKDRSKNAQERFEKAHSLSKAGFSSTQIRKVLAMSGHDKVSQPTISSYLQFETYPEYSAYHKNRIETAKAKRKAKLEKNKVEVVSPVVEEVEPKRTIVSTEAMELNRANLSKAEDLIAEAYEVIKLLKWGLK